MGLDYYDASIYGTLPGLYAEVAAAFEAEYGVCLSLAEMPLLLSFGSLDRRRPRRQSFPYAAGHAGSAADGA